MTQDVLKKRFAEHADVVRMTAESLSESVVEAAGIISDACRTGGELFIFGNGGSAADAQHIAAELIGRYLKERPPVKARALTTDTSILTAVSNDYGYDRVFIRQLEGIIKSGDVALGLTTSGNSKSVFDALQYSRDQGAATIAITGAGGGKCADVVDLLLDVPSDQTPRIQEATMIIYHTICEFVEESIS